MKSKALTPAAQQTGLALTVQEQYDLAEAEGVIERGLETFIEVGNALARIREGRLYRLTHETFEAYCTDRWQMSKTHSNRLIQAANVASDLTPIGVIPTSESQLRPLAPLEPEQRREAMQIAVEASGGKPTAKHVAAAVQQIQQPLPQMANEAPIPQASDKEIAAEIHKLLEQPSVENINAAFRRASDIVNGDIWRATNGFIIDVRDAFYATYEQPKPTKKQTCQLCGENDATNYMNIEGIGRHVCPDCATAAKEQFQAEWFNCKPEIEAVAKAVNHLDRQMAIAAAIDLLEKLCGLEYADDADIFEGIRAALLN